MYTLFAVVPVLLLHKISSGGGGVETFLLPFFAESRSTVIDPMIDHFRDAFPNAGNFTHFLSFDRLTSTWISRYLAWSRRNLTN